jgi:hypothetical protein
MILCGFGAQDVRFEGREVTEAPIRPSRSGGEWLGRRTHLTS